MASRRSASVATPDTAPAKTNGKTRAPSKTQSKSQAARATVVRLRDEACEQARPLVQSGSAPIRVMARMVTELEAQCRELGIPRAIMAEGIVNRTIGDVDVRRISARDDGAEFVTLADEMGLALPGEQFDGYTATGERYRWLHERMEHYERMLLERHIDVRVYDLPALGNPVVREMMSEHARRLWGFAVPPAQIFLSLGSLDGLDKFWRGYKMMQRARGVDQIAVLFPAPGFNVPEWQAISFGLRLHRVVTRAENGFKITPDELRAALEEAPDIQLLYLTVSSNPTAFAYTPDELRALFAVVYERDITIVADLAYIGTGDPKADRARMQTFNEPGTLEHSVLVNSFSKTHTLTGDRLGWVAFGDPQLAAGVAAGWANSMATLPADWQLRYMAIVELYQQHPEIEDKIRALYKLRRERLGRQLQALNKKHHLFAKINLDDGGTVYNWSQLAPGEDVFSLFSKTGIAGVPGGAFGYSDDYVRLSVGCIPIPAVAQ
ncbi:MAG TPA: pyridoxal phosphate-dependent aminotransferase [Ktedonobacterales bacterium]|jgi:aspartate aminotransferase|nr:pyridoxal phosphate-dependent aminotransferase [Ktedonobacterales bacterium]